MARRKDLAGLAALAGLGMLMARKKAGSAEPVKASSASEAKETKEAPSESEEDPMEAANKRTERTLIPNERGAAGTSEAVFPSSKPGSGNRPAAKPAAKSATDNVPRLIDRTPPVGTGSGGGRGPTAEELAAYKPPVSSKYPDIRGSAADSERANMRKNIREGSQAVEGVYPEQMIGGPGLKTMHSIAKGLAGRTAAKEAPAAASPYLKELPAPTKQLTGPSKADLMARDRAARASGRNEEMLRENARRSGLDPDNINPEVAKRVREGLGGSDFSLPMKKGGKVKGYANGGSVGSASKRGDGIASRGKTKCKMY
jgi:hypothetical protein